MEKTRRIKVLSLVAVIVAVLGLTVAFAAMSRTLTINGSANVDPATWDIEFIELSDAMTQGDAKEISKPSISNDGIKIEGINVSVSKPGDRIGYRFKIKNTGTINAKLNKVILNDIEYNDSMDMSAVLAATYPKCDWDGDGVTTDEERASKCMENIEFNDGIIDSYQTLGEDFVIQSNDTTEFATIYVLFREEAEELPKGDVTVNLNFAYEFVQAN